MGPMEILFDNDTETKLGLSSVEIRRRIVEAMPDAEVKIYDLTGSGDHYQLEVVSKAFADKAPLAQHRMVYKLFGDVLGGALHALALNTRPA